jgi:hypothetical protein
MIIKEKISVMISVDRRLSNYNIYSRRLRMLSYNCGSRDFVITPAIKYPKAGIQENTLDAGSSPA